MTRKPYILGAGIGSALLLTASAWGASSPSRDAGDATRAQLSLYASPVIVVRDSGDADAARQARHFIRLSTNVESDAYTGDFMFRDYFRGTHFAQR